MDFSNKIAKLIFTSYNMANIFFVFYKDSLKVDGKIGLISVLQFIVS